MSIDRRPLVRRSDHPAVRNTRMRTGEPLGKLSLPNRPESVRPARHFVRLIAHAYGIEHVADMAVLLVSELATNVTLHVPDTQGTPFQVVVCRVGNRIRVEIHDASSQLPVMRHSDAFDEDGRGLCLVQELAHDYGVIRLTPYGKSTWYELIAWNHEADD